MFYHIEICLFRDGDDEKPQIFPLWDEDEDTGPAVAYLPQEGDFVVIDGGAHMGKVRQRTFAYDFGNDFCHIMINADRVTRPPRIIANDDR